MVMQGGSSFMQTFAGNKVTALMSIFPDIGLDPKKFAKTSIFITSVLYSVISFYLFQLKNKYLILIYSRKFFEQYKAAETIL